MRISGWTSRSRCVVDRAIITCVASDKCDTSWTKSCTRGGLRPWQDRLLQQSVRRLYADCFAGTSTNAEHRCKAADWIRTTGVCRAAHAGASLASCIESDTIQVVYADVRRRAWYCTWLPRGFVSSVWKYATAIGSSRGLLRSIQSTFHDTEVVPFFRPEGLELFAGQRSRCPISNSVCKQTQNASL